MRAASLTWPLVSRRYSQGSTTVAVLRGIHNASMTALMLMLAGNVYLACGGRHPLTGLLATDLAAAHRDGFDRAGRQHRV